VHALPTRAALAALLPLGLAALAACARAPQTAPAPAPVPAPVAATPALPAAPAVTDSAVRAISERLLADSDSAVHAAVPAPRFALDVDVSPFESHDRVARYVALFTGEGRDRFAARVQRGTRFDSLIRGRLRAAGLPEDLTYLALVESGYDPNAVSRASAVGMWQLMAGTARELGLRVDWWVDERRDPVKSTDAAVRNLRWLRKEFGSLFLAAAAYNGGPGRIGRGLAQLAAASDSSVGETRFFALAEGGLLREETVNYVPQIIAAALVASEPARYGIAMQPLAPFAYDSAFVRPLTPLAAVAGAAHATRDELLDLNPQILRGMTPPGEQTLVRLPAGSASGFAARLADASPAERRAFRGVVTKAGQTVARLAEREHVAAAELRRFNPGLRSVKKGKRKGTLVAGQTVRVPTAAVLAYARSIGDVDGDGPTALPVPAVTADGAPAKVTKEARVAVSSARLAEDGGDPEPDAAKPPRHAKSPAAKGGKPSAKGAAKARGAKSTAKSTARSSGKAGAKVGATAKAGASTKLVTNGASKATSKPTAGAKSSAKASPKAKPSAKAKPATKSTAKSAARSTAKSTAKK
jgi:membrane-bound lytic murein transglycosylase D